jgi:hypothetical protein
MREGTHVDVGIDRRFANHAVVLHDHAVGDHRIDNADASLNLAARTDAGPAFELHVRVQHRVLAHLDVGADPRRRRIEKRDARRHQRRVARIAHDGVHLGELCAAVDAPQLVGGLETERLDHPAVGAQDADEIGQVVLPLRVLRRDAVKRREQRRQVEGIDAAVDLGDRALGRGRVLLLDDPGDSALVSDDAAIAEGGGDVRRQHRGRRSRRSMMVDQATKRRGGEQRDVAVNQHQGSGSGGEQRLGLEQGVGSAALRFLGNRLDAGSGDGRRHSFGHMTHNNRCRVRAESAGGLQDMRHHRRAADGVEHLRQLGLHARALAGRENDNVERFTHTGIVADEARSSACLPRSIAA